MDNFCTCLFNFRYEDGRRSSQLYMSACIPKYKTQPHKELKEYYEERGYEREGPFFYLNGNKTHIKRLVLVIGFFWRQMSFLLIALKIQDTLLL